MGRRVYHNEKVEVEKTCDNEGKGMSGRAQEAESLFRSYD